MKPGKTYKVPGDGLSLQMAEWPGDGPAVLCLHGLTANLHCFELVAEGINPACRVLAMDLRGRGLSDKPSQGYSMENHCRDLVAALADMGLARVSLLGHSLGAYLSLAFAARHPEMVEKLILVDGGAELSAEEWLAVGAAIQPAVDRLGKVMPSFEAYLESSRQAPYANPWNSCLEAYFRYEIEEVPGGVSSRVQPDNIAEERANLREFNPSELYAKIQQQVLVLRATKGLGPEMGLVLPERAATSMLASIPQTKLVNLEGADHYSIVFQPNPERDRVIIDFLTGD
jgi:pimeloyl-ACP methyl ester carboxylesterase